MNVLVSNAPTGTNYELQSTNQGDLPVELVPFVPPTPTPSQQPQASRFLFNDVTVAPNSTDASDPTNALLATALVGAATFPGGSLMLITWMAQVRAGAGATAGDVRAGMQIEYSIDGAVSWVPTAGTAGAAFVAVDENMPALDIVCSDLVPLGGQGIVQFRANRFNGITAAQSVLFEFSRITWVYSGPAVP